MVRARGGRRGREFWMAAVARFEQSGRTHREFCDREGLKLETFRAWLYRFRADRGPTPQFVEVTARPSQGPACRVGVGPVEIEFHELPAADYLAALASNAQR